MRKSSCTSGPCLAIALLSLCACSSDSTGGASGATGSGGSSGAGIGPGGNGGTAGTAGSASGASGESGGGGTAGGALDDGGASDAMMAACGVAITKNNSNVTAPTMPIGSCIVEHFDDGMGHAQINYTASDGQAAMRRIFEVDQFATSVPAGTVFKIEDGYDFMMQKGVFVSFSDGDLLSPNVWNADKGAITLTSIVGKTYTIEIAAAHLLPAPDPVGQNHATGDFELNGTVSGTIP